MINSVQKYTYLPPKKEDKKKLQKLNSEYI